MTEYIEREAAIKATCCNCTEKNICGGSCDDTDRIRAIPSADVVPAVRCEECRHWNRCLSDDGSVEYFNFSYCEKGHNGFPTFFCSDGARKDGDGA